MKNTRVLCFGASETYGAWDTQGGWADRLKQKLHELTAKNNYQTRFQFFNLGIGGATSKDLLDRMENEIKPRIGSGFSYILIISIGGNNARLKPGEENFEHSIEEYKQHLEKMISISRKYSTRTIFMGLSPFESETVKFKDYIYKNSQAREIDKAMGDIAGKHQLPKVEIFNNALNNKDFMNSFVDGIHSDDAGHKWLYEQIQPKLLEILVE